MNEDFKLDYIFGERLLISTRADQTELLDNIRAARILLSYFNDMYIRINEHLMSTDTKIQNTPLMENLPTGKVWKVKMALNLLFVKLKYRGAKPLY